MITRQSEIIIYRKNQHYIWRGAKTESTLNIKLKKDTIFLKLPCFCCYLILDYKKEIHKKRGYPVECQLLYSDEEATNLLEDNDYKSNPIFLKINEKNLLSKGYQVEYFDGVNKYDIASGTDLESIKEIKEKIQNDKKLPKGSFELIFDHNVLSDDKKLSDYNIYYQSKINLVVERKYEKLLFPYSHFFVKYKGQAYTAGINGSILEIKKFFSEIIFEGKIKTNKIKIIFRGLILDNDLNIQNEGLCGREMELIVID